MLDTFDAVFVGRVAGLLNLAAFVPYVLAIYGWGFRWNIRLLQKIAPTKPNRATWFIWALVGAIIAPSYSFSGAEETIWVARALVVGPFIIALLSIKRGEGGWTVFDQGCLLGALLSGLTWWLTGSATLGLVMALVADEFGVVPTLRNACREPSRENKLAWTLFFVGDVINLFAVTDWSWGAFPIWIYPVYMIVHTGPILALLLLHSRKGG